MESYTPSPEFIRASKNWEEKGFLGVTAQDHEDIQGTPDDILLENPGKTLGELMSDGEIREYIVETRKNIIENKETPKLEKYNIELQKNLDVTIAYLSSIGRMPEDLI
ncbi:MAG: hypothetical protein WCQ32_02045 [bacterium]